MGFCYLAAASYHPTVCTPAVRELRALTGLRFIAAFYVLIFHFYKRGLLPELALPLRNIVSQGALGVNMFFVLSGLLLTYSYLREARPGQWPSGAEYRRFLTKRLARVYPVYVAGWAVAALVVVSLNVSPPSFGWLLILNLTLTHAWVPPLSMEWYGGGSWSVAVEMFFYLLFPLLLPWLLRVRDSRKLLGLLLVLWALSCGPGLFFAKFPALPLFRWVYAFPPARLPEFMSGMVAGLLVFRQGWRVPGWAVAIAWLLAGAYLARIGPRFEGYVAHNVLVLPALVLTVMHLAAPARSSLAQLLATRLLHYLGRISYGFYIWQLALLMLFDTLWHQHVLRKDLLFSSLSTLGLILLTSVASYHLLEEPARRFVLRRLRATPPIEAPA